MGMVTPENFIGPLTYNQWRHQRYMFNETPEMRSRRITRKKAYDTLHKKERLEKANVYKKRKRAEVRALRPPKSPKPQQPTRDELAEARFGHWRNGCHTQEEAYWLGFIVADGNVCNGRLSVGLQRGDRTHLISLQVWLGAGSITDYTKPDSLMTRYAVGSVALCRRLEALGIVPDKHFKTVFPEIPAPLHRHFIRGVFDGDGCVRRTTKGCWRWNITGNPPLLYSIQSVLVSEGCVKKNKLSSAARNGVTRRLEYDGDRQVARIMAYLYKRARMWLPRKRDLWKR